MYQETCSTRGSKLWRRAVISLITRARHGGPSSSSSSLHFNRQPTISPPSLFPPSRNSTHLCPYRYFYVLGQLRQQKRRRRTKCLSPFPRRRLLLQKRKKENVAEVHFSRKRHKIKNKNSVRPSVHPGIGGKSPSFSPLSLRHKKVFFWGGKGGIYFKDGCGTVFRTPAHRRIFPIPLLLYICFIPPFLSRRIFLRSEKRGKGEIKVSGLYGAKFLFLCLFLSLRKQQTVSCRKYFPPSWSGRMKRERKKEKNSQT